MIQVRAGVFETNSSSVHSLTLFSKEEWQSFKSDPDILIDSHGNLLSKAAAISEMKDILYDAGEITDDDLNEGGYYTHEDVSNGWSGAKHLELPDGSAVVSIYYSGY